MGVGMHRVDVDRFAEALQRFRAIPPLLIDQPELKLRLAIMRIDRRCLHHAMKILPRPQPLAQPRDLTAHVIPGVEEEEWRRQNPHHVTQWSPEEGRRNQRYPR